MADVAARYLGLAVSAQCAFPCRQPITLRCVEVVDRLCAECGELHQDAVFEGACPRCERVHEQRATIAEEEGA